MYDKLISMVIPFSQKNLLLFQSFESCYQFTHYGDSGACFAWDICTSFSTASCSDCISGDSTCASYICSEPGLCNGVQIDFTNENSEDDCLTTCTLTSGCNWYSFDASNGFCLLSETCRDVEQCSTDTCTYGQRECAGNQESKYILYIGISFLFTF